MTSVLLSLMLLYIAGAAISLNYAEAAESAYGHEYYQGQPVAWGPKPRWLFAPPGQAGWYYYGNEWPLVVYTPVCSMWRHTKGHAVPGRYE